MFHANATKSHDHWAFSFSFFSYTILMWLLFFSLSREQEQGLFWGYILSAMESFISCITMEIGWLQVFGCYSLFSWQSLLSFFFIYFWSNVLWARKQASKIPHTRWRTIVIDTFFFFTLSWQWLGMDDNNNNNNKHYLLHLSISFSINQQQQ